MAEKDRIVISNKKVSNGIIMVFRNACNKIGSYDKDKVERFKKKLLEKSLEFGEKLVLFFDEVDYSISNVSDNFFEKIENMRKFDKVLVDDKLIGNHIGETESFEDIDKSVLNINGIVPTRSINFEDLPPIGNVIDKEDDIISLQELKMELLSGDYIDRFSKDNNGIKKK